MKKDGRDKLLERVGETEEIADCKAKPSCKPPENVAPVTPIRKRVLPPPLSIIIHDMKAVLR